MPVAGRKTRPARSARRTARALAGWMRFAVVSSVRSRSLASTRRRSGAGAGGPARHVAVGAGGEGGSGSGDAGSLMVRMVRGVREWGEALVGGAVFWVMRFGGIGRRGGREGGYES